MIIMNNMIRIFMQTVFVLGCIFAILFLLVCILALIEGVIDNFKKRKIRSENIKSLNETFDKMLEDLQKQQEEEKKTSKKARKPRTKKVDKKEE